MTDTTISAGEIYDGLTFNDPNAFFNKPAPDPIVTFSIGGVLFFISFIWWINRTRYLMSQRENPDMNLILRIMISAAIDNDRNLFVMTSYSATSLLFLGGIQTNYFSTLWVMIAFYTLTASLESARVFLGYQSAVEGKVILSSDVMKENYKKVSSKELAPNNVYEDLGRKMFMVMMVFITQVVLISFVFIDLQKSNLSSCMDGTRGCPIGGTMGSWSFFVFGIFMALVFQLGPKTNYGKSEQNPAYWLRLFIELEQSSTITYINEVKGDRMVSLNLRALDIRVILRFFLSFLINGVGFHILVHALPLQVAAQSSLTGVVFRAVGMMYLVDLDDTPGYKLTITKADSENVKDSEELSIKQAINKARALLSELEELAQKKQREVEQNFVDNPVSLEKQAKNGYGSI